MEKELPHLNWFITDNDRAKAQIKYAIKNLEFRLDTLMRQAKQTKVFLTEVRQLTHLLTEYYLRYIPLCSNQNMSQLRHTKQIVETKTLEQAYSHSVAIRQQLITRYRNDTVLLMSTLVSLYQQLSVEDTLTHITDYQKPEQLKLVNDFAALFSHDEVTSWLHALVEFWNCHHEKQLDYALLFHHWDEAQYKRALRFFAQEELINLANAFFFYKLYPDKLFKSLIHPEKLISIRMRVALLHGYVEQLQRQLYIAALQHNLNPETDYLFHGNELPQGIMLEVNEEFNFMIQYAIKYLKVSASGDSEQEITHERLLDLRLAYKFWFNPDRLIDAVMILQHRLSQKDERDTYDLLLFQQQMVALYHQLTTTECLDLYGHFANNNSRYLLYTLYSIVVGRTFSWLEPLTDRQRKAIEQVFQALHCVMESLRIELENRHVHTEPYVDNLYKNNINPGRRNRAVIARILLIYVDRPNDINESIDSLFNDIEQAL